MSRLNDVSTLFATDSVSFVSKIFDNHNQTIFTASIGIIKDISEYLVEEVKREGKDLQ